MELQSCSMEIDFQSVEMAVHSMEMESGLMEQLSHFTQNPIGSGKPSHSIFYFPKVPISLTSFQQTKFAAYPMHVYFISGLGADKRAFQKLQFPASWTIVHLDWLPAIKTETLEDYVIRFSKRINTTQDFCIVGLSFGGMVAVEISKIMQPQKTIIISSISTRHQLPNFLKTIGCISLHQLVPNFLLNKVYPLTDWFFGTKTIEEKQLIRQIIHDSPPSFYKWAIHQIVNWKNTIKPQNLYHIHGTADHIFPINKTNADLLIAEGGHFMVYSKADEISKALINVIDSSNKK